jgi:hypothetical protein
MIRRRLWEAKVLDNFKENHARFLSSVSSRRLLMAVRQKLQTKTENIYVFHWIPDQCEELFGVLVDGETVVHVEVPRYDYEGVTLFETWPVDKYLKFEQKNIPKESRRMLELILRLAREEKMASRQCHNASIADTVGPVF